MRKYSLYILLFLVLSFIPYGVKAITYVDSADKVHDIEEYKKYPYVIDNYNVTVTVTTDNKYLVTEKFTAYYFGNVNVYGLSRVIPLTNHIITFDNSKKTQEVKVYDVSVDNQQFKTYVDKKNNFVIDIGDPKVAVVGEKDYVIRYTYDPGTDHQDYYDEFYFDLIPYSFETVIGSISYTVLFPKPINTNYIRLSAIDRYSGNNSSGLKYVINEEHTKIEGYYGGVLKHNQGINIRIELDDCYFNTKEIEFSVGNYLLTFLPIFLTIIGFVMWYLFGREERSTGDVQYYPPEGFNSLEVGFLFRAKANEKDVLSLLLYLANRGYITIEETEFGSGELLEKGFIVKKKNEYDGGNEYEQKFLDGLFSDKESISNREFGEKFFLMTQDIKKSINKNAHSLTENNNIIKRIILGIFVLVTFGIITIPPMIAYHEAFLLTYVLTTLGFSAMFIMVFGPFDSASMQKELRAQILYRLSGLIIGILLGVLPVYKYLLPCIVDQPLYYIGYIVGIICAFIMCLFIAYMSKRTVYGAETYNKIKGLKHFMEFGNSGVIDKMLKENNNYCFDLLPYAYVLGVTKVWFSKFEEKNILRPFWFEPLKNFNFVTFSDYIDKMMLVEETKLTNYRAKVQVEEPVEEIEEKPKKKKKKKKKK